MHAAAVCLRLHTAAVCQLLRTDISHFVASGLGTVPFQPDEMHYGMQLKAGVVLSSASLSVVALAAAGELSL